MLIPNTRYNNWHSYGKINFYLSGYRINDEESRFLLLKVVEQSIRDYISLRDSETVNEQEYWETARAFLFDDDYRIEWGSFNLNADEILTILNLDLDWVREEVQSKTEGK